VRHVERKLENRDLALAQGGGVAELERRLATQEELVHALPVDHVDLLAQVEEDQAFRISEGDLHVAREIHVLAVPDDAVERRGAGREVLG
jgi:hypothetical protein